MEKDKSKIILSMIIYGFFFVCCLFFERECFYDLGYKFFSKFGKELLEEIEIMWKGKWLIYIVLVYVLINGKINFYVVDRNFLIDICIKLRYF